jgi:hypothetical protein
VYVAPELRKPSCGATWNRTRDLCFIRVTESVKRVRLGDMERDKKGL